MVAKVQCPFCFEEFTLSVYLEDGQQQELIYDCEVCCHPIDIKVTFTEEEQAHIEAERSSGF